ncbi:RNA polymerase II C-terminal domain phosphatase-like 4 [Selaginella moellendorffii]|nr:RNA polymerase II C-terminal domain phosphatase-like 4 [Selaginella moellendorffii]|eukprot:XP_002965594.2 RNA polymerase II C-terminal domain phosphatase-like 4 [Selaginella moellendorffii]
MSILTPPSSPALSSASDDFALLLDSELAAESADEGSEPAANREEAEDLDDENEERRKRLRLDSASNSSCPPHPGFMWGVCIRCGVLKPNSEPGGSASNVALKYIHEEFELAGDVLARVREDELRQVLGKRKLFLVLDLDHTLLNSARWMEVFPDETAYLEHTYMNVPEDKIPALSNGAPAVAGVIQPGGGGLHRIHGMQLWTKLRPFAHKFLEEASKLFEMYVYTMGERMYAVTMAHLLDPTGKFFKGRVISQRDSTCRQTKDLDIVLGADSAVLILDDTEAVWPKHRANLIVMERYHFFQSSCRQFGLENPSLTKAERDESKDEGALANVLKVLQRIHSDFFMESDDSRYTCDVRDITSVVRSEILSGCKLVFSRIFPTDCLEPELTPLWRLCVDLGAECVLAHDDSVTHVVALDRFTDKAKWAKEHRKFLVHPAWVEAAHSLWRRPNELEFPVREGQTRAPVFTFAKTVNVEVERNREEKDQTN